MVLSHFHPDHVGGLREFPSARCIVHADAWGQVNQGGRLNHLHAQIWRELLPSDLGQRLRLLDASTRQPLAERLAAFGGGWDLFDDGSVIAFALPGHAAGQLGLALDCEGERILLVADAFWRREQLDDPRAPPWLTRVLAIRDGSSYVETLRKLRLFRDANPAAWIIPAHCAATLDAWRRRHPDCMLAALPEPA